MAERTNIPGFRLAIVALCLTAPMAAACAWAMGALSPEAGLKIAGAAGAVGIWVLPDTVGVEATDEEEEGAHG